RARPAEQPDPFGARAESARIRRGGAGWGEQGQAADREAQGAEVGPGAGGRLHVRRQYLGRREWNQTQFQERARDHRRHPVADRPRQERPLPRDLGMVEGHREARGYARSEPDGALAGQALGEGEAGPEDPDRGRRDRGRGERHRKLHPARAAGHRRALRHPELLHRTLHVDLRRRRDPEQRGRALDHSRALRDPGHPGADRRVAHRQGSPDPEVAVQADRVSLHGRGLQPGGCAVAKERVSTSLQVQPAPGQVRESPFDDRGHGLRILVTGAEGILGRAIREWLASGNTLYLWGRDEVDVRDKERVFTAAKGIEFDAVIHAAAMTAVDRCETEYDLALATNREGTRHVASLAAERGKTMVYLSTDYIFDGTKAEP